MLFLLETEKLQNTLALKEWFWNIFKAQLFGEISLYRNVWQVIRNVGLELKDKDWNKEWFWFEKQWLKLWEQMRSLREKWEWNNTGRDPGHEGKMVIQERQQELCGQRKASPYPENSFRMKDIINSIKFYFEYIINMQNGL